MKPALTAVFFATFTLASSHGQGTVPTFKHTAGQNAITLLGHGPGQTSAKAIPTVLVPIALAFESRLVAGRPFVMDASPNVPSILASPVFSNFDFPGAGSTQYADAILRASFASPGNWHTLLGKPELRPLKIAVPSGYGYILSSKKSGRSVAVADVEFVQREIFKQIPKQDGKFVIAVTLNTAFYALGDATVCCSWGTHGVDAATGNSFVLWSYLHNAPAVVEDQDIQPLSHQLAAFVKDPLRDPFVQGRAVKPPANSYPAWMRTQGQNACAGSGATSTYFLLEPTHANLKNNFPASPGFVVKSGKQVYHLQNTALLPWYTGPSDGLSAQFSFPDPRALTARSTPCPSRGPRAGGGPPSGMPAPSVDPVPRTGPDNGHKLIGYWAGYGSASSTFPLRLISPQWDVVLVAFAVPDRDAPEGTMRFRPPTGMDPAEFKAGVEYLKSQGKTVMVSLGGGGQHFTLADPKRVPNFVSSITQIVSEYGFEGVDIDFESPSLSIAPGDTDFRNPTTPSIVNLISALRQLRDHFGPSFKISLVPEGTQIPSGYPSYGGQFGSYLPIAHALRDSLLFVDTQSYNTPPLLGLDGEIYQPGTIDYHAAMTELWLQGFNVGGNPKHFFPPFPPEKVAVGFLNGDTTPEIVKQTMDYLITGKAPAGVKYKLRQPGGYPGFMGAMFWTIDADRRAGYNYSNTVGPQLRGYPAAKP